MRKLSSRAGLITVMVASASVLTGCAPAPSSESLVQDALSVHGVPTVSIRIEDVAPSESDRFTINCPYEIVDEISQRLEVDASGLPDYSFEEGRNAIVFATGKSVSAVAAFSVLEVDLCADSTQFGLVYPTNGELEFEKSVKGVWVLTQFPKAIDK